jgi:hypothetical protein
MSKKNDKPPGFPFDLNSTEGRMALSMKLHECADMLGKFIEVISAGFEYDKREDAISIAVTFRARNGLLGGGTRKHKPPKAPKVPWSHVESKKPRRGRSANFN